MVKPERPLSSSSPSSSVALSTAVKNENDEKKYKGVRKRKWGKWVSEVRLPNSRERIWLGSYDTPEKAARAFDAASFCLRGNKANFNFPNQPRPHIPGAGNHRLPPSEIQALAAAFAANHPNSDDDNFSNSTCNSSPSISISISDSAGVQTYPLGDETSISSLPENFTFTDMNNNDDILLDDGVPDFGIYPGFDDNFIVTTSTPPVTDDDEINSCDWIYTPDQPFFLWNF